MQEIAFCLTPAQLHKVVGETTLFLETKQTLRPAFYIGMYERPDWCCKKDKSDKFAANMMTASKIAKRWEMRLYNKTWRVWDGKPSRQQRMDVAWE